MEPQREYSQEQVDATYHSGFVAGLRARAGDASAVDRLIGEADTLARLGEMLVRRSQRIHEIATKLHQRDVVPRRVDYRPSSRPARLDDLEAAATQEEAA